MLAIAESAALDRCCASMRPSQAARAAGRLTWWCSSWLARRGVSVGAEARLFSKHSLIVIEAGNGQDRTDRIEE